MERFDLNVFLLDARVRLVLVLVIIAILIAIFLTYMEFRVKKKRKKVEIESEEERFIRNFLRKINSLKSSREKLDYLDTTAKSFFNEKFETKINSDYSDLIGQFKKRDDITFFCSSMFDAYYSSEVTDEKVNFLSKIFVEIFRNTQIKKTEPQKPSFLDKLEPFFVGKEDEKKKKGNFEGKIILMREFFNEKFKKISKLFARHKKESLSLNWLENFKDMNKEILVKDANMEGAHNKMLQRALMLKQKEIARKRLKRKVINKRDADKTHARKITEKKGDEKRYLTYSL
jgi:hypothetical protein